MITLLMIAITLLFLLLAGGANFIRRFQNPTVDLVWNGFRSAFDILAWFVAWMSLMFVGWAAVSPVVGKIYGFGSVVFALATLVVLVGRSAGMTISNREDGVDGA